jgi:hypothetical protein
MRATGTLERSEGLPGSSSLLDGSSTSIRHLVSTSPRITFEILRTQRVAATLFGTSACHFSHTVKRYTSRVLTSSNLQGMRGILLAASITSLRLQESNGLPRKCLPHSQQGVVFPSSRSSSMRVLSGLACSRTGHVATAGDSSNPRVATLYVQRQ